MIHKHLFTIRIGSNNPLIPVRFSNAGRKRRGRDRRSRQKKRRNRKKKKQTEQTKTPIIQTKNKQKQAKHYCSLGGHPYESGKEKKKQKNSRVSPCASPSSPPNPAARQEQPSGAQGSPAPAASGRPPCPIVYRLAIPGKPPKKHRNKAMDTEKKSTVEDSPGLKAKPGFRGRQAL